MDWLVTFGGDIQLLVPGGLVSNVRRGYSAVGPRWTGSVAVPVTYVVVLI